MIQKITLTLLTVFLLFSCGGASEESVSEEKQLTISEPQKILALGDSLTAGFGIDIEDSYPSQLEKKLTTKGYNYTVVNAGVSGDTSKNLLDRVDIYLDQDPDIIVLVIGGNDGLRGMSTGNMKENILSIIDSLQPTGAKIVVGGMDVPFNLGLQYRSEFRQVYKDIAEEREDIYFLSFFLEGVAGKPTLNIADRIHPNKDGYEIVVANLYDFLDDKGLLTK